MNRNLIIGSGILILGAVLILIFGYKTDKNTKTEFVPFVAAEDLKSIEIKTKEKRISLKRNQDLNAWTLSREKSPDMVVDIKTLLKLFDFVNESYIVQKISKKASTYVKFEVDEEASSHIRFVKKTGDELGIYLGKKKDNSGQFVRKQGDPYVYLLSKTLDLNMDEKTWFYKKILNYPKENLKRITYKTKKGKKLDLIYDKTKSDLNWSGTPPKGKKLKVLKDLISGFHNISINKFIKKLEVPRTKHLVTHIIELGNGTKLRLKVLQERKKKKDSKRYFLGVEIIDQKLSDPKLAHLRTLSKYYDFEIPFLNENIYRREYKGFFEDKPKEKVK